MCINCKKKKKHLYPFEYECLDKSTFFLLQISHEIQNNLIVSQVGMRKDIRSGMNKRDDVSVRQNFT